MKVLIVEDNQAMRRLLRTVIEGIVGEDFAGGEETAVFECKDGAEVLCHYERHRPDWVLMDIHMKTLGGIEATRQLTAAYPQARVVIVTNYNDKRLRELARAAGACDYVLKENLLALRAILADKTPSFCA